MRSFLLTILILLVASIPVVAGDYTLVVSDDPAAPCTEQARKAQKLRSERLAKGEECRPDLGSPIHTSDELIESLNLYFIGQKPKITLLLPAFSNGHLAFCTKREKLKIYEALKDIKDSKKATNKRHLDDFINILGVKNNKAHNHEDAPDQKSIR